MNTIVLTLGKDKQHPSIYCVLHVFTHISVSKNFPSPLISLSFQTPQCKAFYMFDKTNDFNPVNYQMSYISGQVATS